MVYDKCQPNMNQSTGGLRRPSHLPVEMFEVENKIAVQAPVLEDARGTLQQANAIANRIIDLADRLCGPRNSGIAGDGAPAVSPNILDRFRAEMRDTRQAMIFADDALTRIEQELIG